MRGRGEEGRGGEGGSALRCGVEGGSLCCSHSVSPTALEDVVPTGPGSANSCQHTAQLEDLGKRGVNCADR